MDTQVQVIVPSPVRTDEGLTTISQILEKIEEISNMLREMKEDRLNREKREKEARTWFGRFMC